MCLLINCNTPPLSPHSPSPTRRTLRLKPSTPPFKTNPPLSPPPSPLHRPLSPQNSRTPAVKRRIHSVQQARKPNTYIGKPHPIIDHAARKNIYIYMIQSQKKKKLKSRKTKTCEPGFFFSFFFFAYVPAKNSSHTNSKRFLSLKNLSTVSLNPFRTALPFWGGKFTQGIRVRLKFPCSAVQNCYTRGGGGG